MKIASIVIVILILGGGIWYFFFNPDQPTIEKDASGRLLIAKDTTAEPCAGDLLDTHMHLDEYSIPAEIAPQMADLGVGCGVMFMRIEPDDPAESAELLQESIGNYPNRFIPFMFIDPQTAESQNVDRLRKAFTATNVPWKGLGEVAFYRDPFRTDDLTSDKWDAQFAFAAENDLVFMIHPRSNQADEVRQLLADHPTTKILFHGTDLPIATISDILKTFPNVYFTLDTASFVTTPSILGPLQFADQMNPTRFAEAFDANRQAMLDAAVTTWSAVISANPDRIMWGTDVAFDWHADPAVYSRLVQFSKDFIARLPGEVQQPYAIGNAQTLFGVSAVSLISRDD